MMQNKITRKYIQDHPYVLFVFGDNDKRYGLGGMAKEFRGEINSIGIRTKKAPSMGEQSFYTDAELKDNIVKIADDISRLFTTASCFSCVYIPDGIGMGRARLDTCAPLTFLVLKRFLDLAKDNLRQWNIVNSQT